MIRITRGQGRVRRPMRIALYLVVLGLFVGMVVAPIMDWQFLGFLVPLSLVAWLGLFWLHRKNPVQ